MLPNKHRQLADIIKYYNFMNYYYAPLWWTCAPPEHPPDSRCYKGLTFVATIAKCNEPASISPRDQRLTLLADDPSVLTVIVVGRRCCREPLLQLLMQSQLVR